MAFTPLNALNAFLAVAKRRSFAAAARDLGVSTSALSQSVRQLEERLGVPLLVRTSRSVAATDAGRRLLENAGPAIEQALESLKTVAMQPGEVTGKVKLSVPTGSVELVLDRLIPTFLERHPHVELDIHHDDALVDVVAGGFDAGIRLMETLDRDMVHVRLTQPFRFVMVASPAYLARRGTPQKPEDLLQHECIGMRWGTMKEPWPWELERGKRLWRIPVRSPVTTNDPTLMRRLALSGLGLLYVVEELVAADLARDRLRLVLEPYAPTVPGFFLYFPSRAQISPAFRAFVEVARETAARETRETAARRKRKR